jgi:hypothetical protein
LQGDQIEKALVAHLLTNATIRAAVQSGGETRIYPMRAPQTSTTLPRIVYQMISTIPLDSMDGDLGFSDGRCQIKCTAATYLAAKALAKAIRAAGNTFRGDIAGTVIVGTTVEKMIDLPEALPAGSDRGFNTVSQDWFVTWKED